MFTAFENNVKLKQKRNKKMENSVFDQDGSLILESLITALKLRGYFLEGAAIAYYCFRHEIYICCATDPIPRSLIIPAEDYQNLSTYFTIRAKLGMMGCEAANLKNNDLDQKEKKRPKERRISFVISKVMQWRKFYAGIIDDNGQIIKYSLEEAAEKVGISKKSLDDYMLQLRLGKKFGFDFEKNKDKKVGVLRAFIKGHKKNKGDMECTNDIKSDTKSKKKTKN